MASQRRNDGNCDASSCHVLAASIIETAQRGPALRTGSGWETLNAFLLKCRLADCQSLVLQVDRRNRSSTGQAGANDRAGLGATARKAAGGSLMLAASTELKLKAYSLVV